VLAQRASKEAGSLCSYPNTSLLITLSLIGLPSMTLMMFYTATIAMRSSASLVTPATCDAGDEIKQGQERVALYRSAPRRKCQMRRRATRRSLAQRVVWLTPPREKKTR